VLFLVGNPWRIFAAASGKRGVIISAFVTGVFIAAYTIWDKEAVSTLRISPLLLSEGSCLLLTCMLFPAALKDWSKVKETWQAHRLKALGVGFLSPLAYLLILFALISSPVSQVAPLRESSVLIGTFMGARFLSEKRGWSRLGAAALIMAGIILLAVSP
jgi:drug/metabolite transporter (DMT)-like permease